MFVIFISVCLIMYMYSGVPINSVTLPQYLASARRRGSAEFAASAVLQLTIIWPTLELWLASETYRRERAVTMKVLRF